MAPNMCGKLVKFHSWTFFSLSGLSPFSAWDFSEIRRNSDSRSAGLCPAAADCAVPGMALRVHSAPLEVAAVTLPARGRDCTVHYNAAH